MLGATNILLVEDNLGDRHMVEQAFEERDIPATLHTVGSGDRALNWVYQRDMFAEAPRPDLVLLDLNLPAVSGQTVLEEIKSDPELKAIPVIIITGSESETELREVYKAHANACVIKPVDPAEFGDLIQSTVAFWTSTARLPPRPDHGPSSAESDTG